METFPELSKLWPGGHLQPVINFSVARGKYKEWHLTRPTRLVKWKKKRLEVSRVGRKSIDKILLPLPQIDWHFEQHFSLVKWDTVPLATVKCKQCIIACSTDFSVFNKFKFCLFLSVPCILAFPSVHVSGAPGHPCPAPNVWKNVWFVCSTWTVFLSPLALHLPWENRGQSWWCAKILQCWRRVRSKPKRADELPPCLTIIISHKVTFFLFLHCNLNAVAFSSSVAPKWKIWLFGWQPCIEWSFAMSISTCSVQIGSVIVELGEGGGWGSWQLNSPWRFLIGKGTELADS